MSIPEDEPYPHWFNNSFFNYCKIGICLKNEGNPLGSVFVPYVMGISHQFKCIGNHYSITTVFKMKHTV